MPNRHGSGPGAEKDAGRGAPSPAHGARPRGVRHRRQGRRLTGRDSGQDGGAITNQMNERQQAHIDCFLESIEYWKSRNYDGTAARMLAARDADQAHPMWDEEEAVEAFTYLRELERGQVAD